MGTTLYRRGMSVSAMAVEEVRHGHGDDQVEGLQIGDLPLARHTQDEEDEDVQEHRPEKQYQHRNSMTEKYIPDS